MASNLEHFTPDINTKDYYILSVSTYNFWDKEISWCNQVFVQSSGSNLNHNRVQSSIIHHFNLDLWLWKCKKLHKPILTCRTA